MRLSVGVLYDCQKFIALCDTAAFELATIREAFRTRYNAAPIDAVVEMANRAGWITFDRDGALILSPRGREILECKEVTRALRLQILDYVEAVRPPWGALIPGGRQETLPFLPPDARQCFREAGADKDYDDETVGFWDEAAALVRGRQNDLYLAIGRRGEKLSIAHEIARTGRCPEWKAVDTNKSGYDLLSIVSESDPTPLKIEVKATTQLDQRAFHLSRGEWRCAMTQGTYLLHFWLLSEPPILVVKTVDDLSSHVPQDSGLGEWQSVKISTRGI